MQQRLLPSEIPDVKDCESQASWQPANDVGGDSFESNRIMRKRRNYFFVSADSIAPVNSGDCGSTLDAKRPRISPALPIKNFSKFQLTSPANLGFVDGDVRCRNNATLSGPSTSTFENMSNSTP